VIALASRRLGDRADRLEVAAAEALAAGFSHVFASVPAADPAAARRAIAALGISLDGVSTPPVADLRAVGPAIDAAAQAASVLKVRLVVLDAGPLPRGSVPEADLETLARALFDATRRWAGASIAVRPGAGAKALLKLPETEALLSDLDSKPVGLFLDPARADTPPAWAERLGRKTMGVTLFASDEDGPGQGLLAGTAIDWSTLRGMLPARAVRVLDVGPFVPPETLEQARRRFEESLKF
jgi:hypothetical protein